MKAIRIQIDMLYKVDDDEAEGVYRHDVEFFNALEKDFNSWSDNKNEKRTPISFDFRHGLGDVIEEEGE